MDKDLKVIKKKYGEDMMHFCRESFSTLLEIEGLLSDLLINHFEPNHELYKDLVKNYCLDKFKKYIFYLLKNEENDTNTEKTPKELLDEAGYILYECKTEKDIQAFKKYYAKNEVLCTFNARRLDRCYVFFAVKKNVDEIKREDFKNPERQDEYGTSVMSIQFTRDDSHVLSIKNRYNHTVENPDATFSNDLDNIILGLTNSFAKFYGLVQRYQQSDFEIPSYVQVNNKFYKYIKEINNIYYCENNIIIDNFKIKSYEKEKYLIFDYFILDLQNKSINLYDKKITDSFMDDFKDFKDIQIKNIKDGKIIYLTPEVGEIIEIEIDNNNQMVGYKNNNIHEIGSYFLPYNTRLQKLECSKLQKIGDYFLKRNVYMKKISLPSVIEIGNKFLENDWQVNEIFLPSIQKIGDYFLLKNYLKEISFPNLKKIGNHFMTYNSAIAKIDLPNVEIIGMEFLKTNAALVEVNLPSALEIGNEFICCNERIEKIDLPMVKKIGTNFLEGNIMLKEISLPNVESIDYRFLYSNNTLSKIFLPNVITIYANFLAHNYSLQTIDLPKVKNIDNRFLYCNTDLREINCPDLVSVGNDFLYYNIKLNKISFPKLKIIGNNFIDNNVKIMSAELPEVEEIGYDFLPCNSNLNEVWLPKLRKVGINFLYSNNCLQKLYAPSLVSLEDYFLRFIDLSNIELTINKKVENTLKMRK